MQPPLPEISKEENRGVSKRKKGGGGMKREAAAKKSFLRISLSSRIVFECEKGIEREGGRKKRKEKKMALATVKLSENLNCGEKIAANRLPVQRATRKKEKKEGEGVRSRLRLCLSSSFA